MKTKKRGTILVVEDQQSWRELMVAILERDGHVVLTANTFKQGRDMLLTRVPDVVILDMRLIDNASFNIGGMALLKETKQCHPSAKAIILTGYPNAEQRDRAINTYGANGYFEKAPDGKFLDVNKFRKLIVDLLNE